MHFNAKNYCFTLSIINEASEKAKQILKKLYPSATIDKILECTLQELFEKQVLYFYKISEVLEVTIEKQKVQIVKITVLVFFKIRESIKKFQFFYYENIENRQIIDYENEKVQESQKIFVNFFKNLVCLLQKNNFGFFENYNIFYYMFLHPDIEPCNIRCYFMDFVQTEKISSYIEYIKLICFIYESEGFNFELHKFKCENYELLSNNFCFIFEYNDQKMITDLQTVDKNRILFEENYYYMFKNIQCVNVKANLCILPYFENIPKDSILVQKEKIIKSIDYLKNNISKELKHNLSESKKQKLNETINYHEINFIKENEWLVDFFDKQINIENIKVYINDLNFRDFEILSDKKSDFDVKNKLIRDWLCENSLTNKTNKSLNLHETNIELINLPTKV